MKKRIIRNINFVVKQVFVEEIEAGGLAVGNKMHFVAFLRQRFAQFGSHHAGAAKSWVTNNAYFHSNTFLRAGNSNFILLKANRCSYVSLISCRKVFSFPQLLK